ncbi:YHS domain-containing (seleno)protein [Acuticoccus sp. I52.16.1]|uniref:YHS domain-containing (seleno)protein n=1 Tax=Acuticoccus sp. I52.16.1 TaxID=2928472 RepID=UPI001FD12E25|nr:YHS domain-containing (seleno)protein [Acuticoccus sp. I52.16.1]UOM33429.1 hypothetical protein MRB58_16430 [Acuticoccus sp. I52.16.1]
MKRFALAALVAVATVPAMAGEQYVNSTGYANSGYDVVAYFELEQAPVGGEQPPAVPGSSEFTATYNGATFAFADAQNLARFEADPQKYAPQYDGHCAYGVTKGGKVPGNPNLWRIVDGKLYLNITPNVVSFWEEDVPGNLAVSEEKWPAIESGAASTMAIPKFTPAAPNT